MKKIIMLLGLAIIGVAAWYFFETKPKPDEELPKQQPLAVSQHSDSFNISVNRVLDAYYSLSEAFVNWDSTAVKTKANTLLNNLQQANFEELRKDSLIHQTAMSFIEASKEDVNEIIKATNLTGQRRAFQQLTPNMYDLMRTIRYDGAKIYLQECPMAFNDDETAQWLSKSPQIRNPYLGLYHPKYKKGMLECGEVRDSLQFVQ